MSAVVCFTTEHGTLGLPVSAVRGVVDRVELAPMPAPRPGVAGLLRPDREALPVLDVFGDGVHLLLLLVAGRRFGLIAGEVTGVVRTPEDAPEPMGAAAYGDLIAGTVRGDGQTILLVDEHALLSRLDGSSGPTGVGWPTWRHK